MSRSEDVSNNTLECNTIQYNTIEITICSTPDVSVLYQYMTFDCDTYTFQELTQWM